MFAEGRFSSEQRNQQAEKNTQGHAQRHAATRHDQCHSLGWPSQGASQRSQRLVSNASRRGISRRQSIR